MQYSAFISYSSHDRATAVWLHRALERYRVPQRLHGRPSPFGPVAARLPPVFRDRDELAASADLGEAIRAALAQSAMLIVICSPAAVASQWVNAEIRSFTALGRRDRIRCLIVDGEPHAADRVCECLPPALFDAGGAEPLAADIRPGQDSRNDARLKLVAGILDLPFDELKQREAARRQRRLAIIAAAAMTGFVIAAGLAITALLARQEAVRQRDIARQRTITAERTVDFVKSMFKVSDPSEARGASITAREILDRGARNIEHGLAQEPAVQAELGVTLAEVYGSLGLYREGERLVRWTLVIPHGQAAVRAGQYLALGEAQQNAGDYAAAIASFRQGLAAAETRGVDRPEMVSRALVGIGQAQSALGAFAAAAPPLQRALALDSARLGSGHPDVARDLEDLGLNHYYAGQPAAARPYFTRALAIRLRTEGTMSPSVADNRNSLGNIARETGDLAAAEDYLRPNLAIDEKVLGPDHPDFAATLNNFARILIERRKFVEAEALLRRAIAITLKQRDPMHDDFAFAYDNLGLAIAGQARFAEAMPWFDKAIAVARLHNHRNLAPAMTDLAAAHCRTGHVAKGMALIDTATPIMAARYPDEAWRTAWTQNVRGECLLRSGAKTEARNAIGTSAFILGKRWAGDSYYAHEAARRIAMADAD